MLLSVVVTIVDGGPALIRCLEGLEAQQGGPSMEVIIPFDDSLRAALVPTDRFPRFTFLPLGAVRTDSPAASALGQHELFDRRRAAGLTASRGDLVAILEDRGVPRPDWAAAFARLHNALPHAVIGGAIENGVMQPLNQAVYFCDFGRYERPFRAHVSPFASDVNVCYKRVVLESVKDLWADRYHEPVVHRALIRGGHTVFLSPEPAVDQVRGQLQLGRLCRERVAWGFLYAGLRRQHMDWVARLTLITVSPLLPVLLLARIVRDRAVKSHGWAALLTASPWVIVLLCAWSAGEALGYLGAGRAGAQARVEA